jgi:hypothetical protein
LRVALSPGDKDSEAGDSVNRACPVASEIKKKKEKSSTKFCLNLFAPGRVRLVDLN